MKWSFCIPAVCVIAMLLPQASSAQVFGDAPSIFEYADQQQGVTTTLVTSTVVTTPITTSTLIVEPVSMAPVTTTEPMLAEFAAVTTTVEIPPILAAVREARQVLETTPHEHPATAKIDTDYRDLTLAIWEPGKEIEYVDVKKKGTSLKCTGTCPVKVTYSNGLNSTFEVLKRPNAIVVALRYPLYLEQGTGKKKNYRIEEVVYTPYSAGLRSQELVDAGKAYFSKTINQVFVDLNQKGIRSKAFNDRPLTQVVDEQLAKAIMTIEHADTAALKTDPDHALDRFYITLATNEDQAFGYSRSSAGALGVAQFMPKTYAAMVARNPQLKLEPNFDKAMRSVSTSLKAQMLYLDTLLTELPIDARLGYFEYPEESREFMVAAYNGGAGRIRLAMSFWVQATGAKTTDFSLAERKQRLRDLIQGREEVLATYADPGRKQQQLKEIALYKSQLAALEALTVKTTPGLKKETVDYLKKYRSLLPSFT